MHIGHVVCNRSLCDMKSVGMLNVEAFCLAMHLISEKTRRGVDPPATLEPSMVPPSMRAAAPAATMSMVGGVVVQDPELLKSPEVAALIAEIDQIKRCAFILLRIRVHISFLCKNYNIKF